MGTCGSKISPPGRSADGTRPPLAPLGSSPLKRFCLIIFYLFTFLLVGCPTIQHGWRPPVERLGALAPRISTPEEVLMTLGEPRGRGMIRYTPEAEPGRIWFYEYVESDGRKVNFKFLLVFFKKEVYEGYFWFFSEKTKETEWFVGTPPSLEQEKERQVGGERRKP